MGRAYRLTVAALGLVVVVAACGQQASSPKSGGGPSGTIHIHLPGNWDQLNPHKMTSTTSWFPVSAMYDRLVFLTADGKYVPYLAKSWQVTPDTLTFTLRTDAVCADGAPVTSAVVVNSFKDFFATSYYAGDFGGPVTVSAPDTDHVILKLAKPNSNILYEFARPPTSIVCPGGLASGVDFTSKSFGSGPYTLLQAVQSQQATVTARPGSPWRWGPEGLIEASAGFAQTIVYDIVTNPTTAANLLLTAGLDVIQAAAVDVPRLAPNKGLTHKVARSYLADVAAFGEAAGQVTTNQAVRQAISTAIDRRAFITAAYAGYADPATSTLAPNAECYDSQTGKLMPTYDLNRAKSILLSAGYSAGPDGRLSKGGKPLAVTVVGLNTMGDGPDYVQAQLDRLGIQTTLQKVDAGTYSVLKFGNKGDVFLNRFLSDWPTHNVSIVQLNGPSVGAANPQHIESPVIDQAVQAARTTLGAESCRGWATVQRELVGQNYVLPLAVEQVHWFSRKGLNFEPSASVGYTDSLTLRRTG